MNSGFGDDICIESVAKVNGVNVVTVQTSDCQ